MRRNTATAVLLIIGAASCASWCRGATDDKPTASSPADTEDDGPPTVVSAMIVAEDETAFGKKVELCFDRLLRPRERLHLKYSMVTTAGTRKDCSQLLSSGPAESTCHRLDALCLNRFTTKEEQRIVAEEIGPGTVTELTVEVAKTYGFDHGKTYTFTNL